jgi:hypothetical protein
VQPSATDLEVPATGERIPLRLVETTLRLRAQVAWSVATPVDRTLAPDGFGRCRSSPPDHPAGVDDHREQIERGRWPYESQSPVGGTQPVFAGRAVRQCITSIGVFSARVFGPSASAFNQDTGQGVRRWRACTGEHHRAGCAAAVGLRLKEAFSMAETRGRRRLNSQPSGNGVASNSASAMLRQSTYQGSAGRCVLDDLRPHRPFCVTPGAEPRGARESSEPVPLQSIATAPEQFL